VHLHTPASADWLEPGTTYLEWLQKAESRGLDIVAITDHNTVEGVARLRAEIERLTWLEANDRLRPQERRELDEYRRLGDKILVLPGFEFTATFGFHILAIFPPETPLRKLELLLLRLGVPIDRLTEGSTEAGPTTDVLTAYHAINDAGGIVIAAHANSTHGVALQGMSFGGQTRIAFTQDRYLHALEVNDLESTSRRATARFFDGSKPEYPRRMHCIQGSDAHRLNRDPKDKNRLGVGERVTEILMPEVSFDALKNILDGTDFSLTRPYRPPAEAPFDHVEAAREQGSNIVQSFHESITREAGRLHKVLCDVVAFANTRGGTIYLGVSATRKTPPKGIENPDAAVVLLRKEIERNIAPPIEPMVDTVMTQGVPIIRVSVREGPDKPYALNQTRIYVRQEGETNEAVRDEIVQLVLAGQPAETAGREAVADDVSAAPSPAEIVPVQAAAVSPAVLPPAQAETSVPALPAAAKPEVAAGESLPLPAIGVEIVAVDERKGARYFTIRDLRNGNTIQNVTLHSARKLWSYAINQYMANPIDPARVTWVGNMGVWQVARRAKRLRYDLALRMPDGRIRAFYGVTADGMTGVWAQFLQAEDKANGEHEAPAVEVTDADAFEMLAGDSWAHDESEAYDMPPEGIGEGEEPALPAPEADAAEASDAAPSQAAPRRRTRRSRPKSKAKTEAQPAGDEQAMAAEPEAAAPVQPETLAVTEPEPSGNGAEAATPAEPARKPRTRRPRAKPQAETAAAPVTAEAPAEAPAPAAATTNGAAEPAAAEAAPSEAAPVEAKPKRTRTRKPKAPPAPEG
jgi:hypothetical protein